MQRILLQVPLMFTATAFSQAHGSSQFQTSQFVITTISGPARNAVFYAPKPPYPPAALQQHLSGRGVYKMDIDNGIPYDVRVVRSSGHKILDDAAVETLRTWRFRPHRLVWVTIPIEFRAANSPTKASTS